VQQIKLTIRQLFGARKYSVSYRVTWLSAAVLVGRCTDRCAAGEMTKGHSRSSEMSLFDNSSGHISCLMSDLQYAYDLYNAHEYTQ